MLYKDAPTNAAALCPLRVWMAESNVPESGIKIKLHTHAHTHTHTYTYIHDKVLMDTQLHKNNHHHTAMMVYIDTN